MEMVLRFKSFTEIFHENPGSFNQSEFMQHHIGRKMRHDLMPDGRDKILYRTHLALHEIHIQIQVPMIELLYDVPVHQRTEFLGIENETSLRIGLSLYGNMQLEVVAMPVFIGTLAKNSFIPLP